VNRIILLRQAGAKHLVSGGTSLGGRIASPVALEKVLNPHSKTIGL
jgi:predicted alpha/beta-hydrolase family hydrolase